MSIASCSGSTTEKSLAPSSLFPLISCLGKLKQTTLIFASVSDEYGNLNLCLIWHINFIGLNHKKEDYMTTGYNTECIVGNLGWLPSLTAKKLMAKWIWVSNKKDRYAAFWAFFMQIKQSDLSAGPPERPELMFFFEILLFFYQVHIVPPKITGTTVHCSTVPWYLSWIYLLLMRECRETTRKKIFF